MKQDMASMVAIIMRIAFVLLMVNSGFAQDSSERDAIKAIDTAYYIQLLAFSEESLAKEALHTARRRLNMPVVKVKEDGLSKVRVGPFAVRDSAYLALRHVHKHYPDAFIVKVVQNGRRNPLFPFKRGDKEKEEGLSYEVKCYIQTGSFMSRSNALTESWKYDKYPNRIVFKGDLWRLWLGPFDCKEVYNTLEDVKVINPDAFVVRDTVAFQKDVKVISRKPSLAPYPQTFRIYGDVDSLNSVLIEKKKGSKTIQGYRVQLATSPKRQEIFELKAKFMKENNNIPAYVVYDPPLFKLQVGNYLRLMDARRARIELSKKYPNAIVVWQEIPIDEIERTYFSDSK